MCIISAMRLFKELACTPIFRELGYESRYMTLPGQALLEGSRRNDSSLKELAYLLATLVETIPYNNDYFDIVVAPLADQIEGILGVRG